MAVGRVYGAVAATKWGKWNMDAKTAVVWKDPYRT